ncbi:hypothetical protein [Iningainema tapete]|uniref:DUF4280 domain-containing protein n=1 Tax=Iningainema tapete BLCC-T55 TaxID=2748662 RepID=A0A8J7C5Q8_9CYAN|nr:hypothetical protein [Iningainema tapete]MBD2773369.1 hypothetical protein [Iningainema tapete BLCC-T55]
MPGYVLHFGASVLCAHAGQGQPIASNPRVKVSGQSIVTQVNNYTITGCTLPSLTAGAPPCATAQWVSAAVRVKAGGMPVLLQDSRSICAPTSTPLNVVATQIRVKGI